VRCESTLFREARDLGREARLADPGLAAEQNDCTRAGAGLLETPAELVELTPAPYKHIHHGP
jgi:hypothetical protein